MNLKGAILSGGYGKRLYPYTKDVPKTMLELNNGTTILDIQLLDFKRAGINEVYLLVGYKKEVIEGRYGSYWNGMNIKYLEEEKPMGTLWALRNLFQRDESDFVIRNGDTICDADMTELIRKTDKNNKKIGLVATKMVSPYGILEIKGNTIVDFKEKPVLDYYINSGFYYFRREVKNYLEMEYPEKEIEKTVFPLLAHEHQIYAFKHHGLWKSVDSIKDYEEAISIFSKRRDYDFGYVYENSIMMYSSKAMNVRGNFNIKLVKGSALINGERMKLDLYYRIDGEATINSIKQSYFSFGGKIENW